MRYETAAGVDDGDIVGNTQFCRLAFAGSNDASSISEI
jgi:hypothetical protein